MRYDLIITSESGCERYTIEVFFAFFAFLLPDG